MKFLNVTYLYVDNTTTYLQGYVVVVNAVAYRYHRTNQRELTGQAQ